MVKFIKCFYENVSEDEIRKPYFHEWSTEPSRFSFPVLAMHSKKKMELLQEYIIFLQANCLYQKAAVGHQGSI